MKSRRVFSLFTVLFIAFLLCRAVTIVPTGYTGVKTSFGQIQETTIQSGKLNFTVPFVQSIHTVNNKQQDKNIETQIWGEASDKTPVYAADVIVTYQVLPEKSAWLYANVSDTKNLVGDELVASAIKSAMAELGPNEVTNRTKIEPLAQQKLAESLNQKYGEGAVYINKVVINDMDFEEAYNAAIQQKSIAQQNAAKQKIENEAAIAKAEADKQVAITKAEAEAQKTSIAADAQAEANRKIAESLSEPLIEYQKIQKWDGKLPTVSGGNALVSIDPGRVKKTHTEGRAEALPFLHEMEDKCRNDATFRMLWAGDSDGSWLRNTWERSTDIISMHVCAIVVMPVRFSGITCFARTRHLLVHIAGLSRMRATI